MPLAPQRLLVVAAVPDRLVRARGPAFLSFLLAGLVATGCGNDSRGGDDAAAGDAAAVRGSITVFAAASLTDVFEELSEELSARYPDVSVTFNFAGSSALREQILAGAPADVFASADETTMADVEAGDALDGEPVAFASNRLTLAVPAGNLEDVTDLADLADPDLLVGLCAEEVPCGRLAEDVLDRAEVEAAVDTYEPSVRSLLTKLAAGELDAGLVYQTDVLASGGDVEGLPLAVDDDVTVRYPIAPLADSGRPAAAQAFVDFVLSEPGQAILRSHGFESQHSVEAEALPASPAEGQP